MPVTICLASLFARNLVTMRRNSPSRTRSPLGRWSTKGVKGKGKTTQNDMQYGMQHPQTSPLTPRTPEQSLEDIYALGAAQGLALAAAHAGQPRTSSRDGGVAWEAMGGKGGKGGSAAWEQGRHGGSAAREAMGGSAAWEMGGKGGKGGSAAWEVMGGKGGPPLGLSPSPDGIWHRCHFFGEDAGCEEWGVMSSKSSKKARWVCRYCAHLLDLQRAYSRGGGRGGSGDGGHDGYGDGGHDGYGDGGHGGYGDVGHGGYGDVWHLIA